MRFRHVCLEALGYLLPSEIVTSDGVESQLAPLYQRLRLPEGRLELMTGIRERRVWSVGTMPSGPSIQSAQAALDGAGVDRQAIGALVHASVCRDHLEPATACQVHHALDLSPRCHIFDLSNACLGLLNGMLQVANMIELGQVRAGLVVGTEGSRPLLETTIRTLNHDTQMTRRQAKSAMASLTIGSASCAVLLTHASISKTGNHLRAAAVRAHTQHHRLCQSGADEAAAGGMQPLMDTDSETLLREGVATGQQTFTEFREVTGWQPSEINTVITHQVTVPHRRLMYETLGLELDRDFSTVEWLGNTGSVALPITLAIGAEAGQPQRGDRVALLGIGSGINCVMVGLEWHAPCVWAAQA